MKDGKAMNLKHVRVVFNKWKKGGGAGQSNTFESVGAQRQGKKWGWAAPGEEQAFHEEKLEKVLSGKWGEKYTGLRMVLTSRETKTGKG